MVGDANKSSSPAVLCVSLPRSAPHKTAGQLKR